MHFTLPQLFKCQRISRMPHKRFLLKVDGKKRVEKNIKYSINIATTVFHSPLRKLHCYQYRAYLTQHLSSPALIHVASFSWSRVVCPPLDLLKVFKRKNEQKSMRSCAYTKSDLQHHQRPYEATKSISGQSQNFPYEAQKRACEDLENQKYHRNFVTVQQQITTFILLPRIAHTNKIIPSSLGLFMSFFNEKISIHSVKTIEIVTKLESVKENIYFQRKKIIKIYLQQ